MTARVVSQEMGVCGLVVSLGTRMAEGFQLWVWRGSVTEVILGIPGGSAVKNPAANAGTWVPSLGREDPLEKEMATHSRIPAWRIPWTEDPGGLLAIYIFCQFTDF